MCKNCGISILLFIMGITLFGIQVAHAADLGNTYYFKNTISGGEADKTITYGKNDDQSLVGDWDGDGIDTLAIRRKNLYHFKNTISGGEADKIIAYGKLSDEVLVGDWDGDGIDTLVIRRGNLYYFKNSISSGEADKIIAYGKPSDEVLIGDWNGDGIDTIAVRRDNTYYVKNSISGGEADKVIAYGKPSDEILIGDWDGDSQDTFAVKRSNVYYLKNSLNGGEADSIIGYGNATDAVLVGDWNGDNLDTLAVRRNLHPIYTGILANIAASPTAKKTNQIVGVVANGSYATVYLFEKVNNTWKIITQTNNARVGQNGVAPTSEGQRKTPVGSYPLGFSFGMNNNPGTKLAYRKITNNSYWISNINDPQYNTWQERSSSSSADEHLASYPVQYKYAITIGYNSSNAKGVGSAFFLHCNSTSGGYTAGCVSVPEATMLYFMHNISNNAYITIGTSAAALQNY